METAFRKEKSNHRKGRLSDRYSKPLTFERQSADAVSSGHLLSVVILSYNTADTTLRCLDSIYDHAPTIADLEVVVIDNNSSDASADAIEERFPNVALIRNASNRGFSAACNQGIRASRGEIVLLLNSDTQLLDQSLDVVVDYMIRNPDIGIAGGNMIGPDGKPQPTCHVFPTYKNLLFSKTSLFSGLNIFRRKYATYRFAPNKITDVDAMAGGFLFLRREALLNVGLLDERFFFYVEDIDIARRMKDAGWRVVFIPKAKVAHLGGASTARHPSKSYAWHHKSLFRYFMKHHPWLLPINLVFGLGLLVHYSLWWTINLLRHKG